MIDAYVFSKERFMEPNYSINRWLMAMVMATTLTMVMACSVTVGSIGHGINTEVQLNQNNFTVIKSVTGEATATYVFGVFGPSKGNLLDQARRDMVEKAGLVGTSNALINVTTDMKTAWNPLVTSKTAYVSGEVVQFRE